MSALLTAVIDIDATPAQVWEVLTNDDGTTRLTNREEFSGILTTLTKPVRKLGNSDGYARFNRGLKTHVESRTSPG